MATDTIYEGLLRQARMRPTAIAILYGSDAITYASLLGAVDVAALVLRECGIGHGIPFAVYSQSRPEVLVAYFAAAKLGAIFVPINPNMTAPEVAHVVRHSEAPLLFYDGGVGDVARQAVPQSALRPIESLAHATGASPSGSTTSRIGAEDDFLIIYTSGSTGAPKAVVFDHAAQMAGLASLTTLWSIDARDVTLVALPLGYLYGLSTACATALLAGGEIVVQRRFHPGELLDAFVASRATVFHGVPTMFSMMLAYAEERDLRVDLSGVRALICAGAPLPVELRERFAARFDKEIEDYYALTEATPVFGKFAADPVPIPRGSVGKAAPGVAARIVDSEHRDCAVDEPGELIVRAPLMLKRYHKDPELTRASFVDGYFKTGDLARRDAAGYYTLTGRMKDIIIRGGANIAPAEVEAVLARHPSVQDAAVIGVPDTVYGEVPVAFVVQRPGATLTAQTLVEHAARALADFKVPHHYSFETSLPLGMTGKVDKNALRALWKARKP